MMSRKMFSKACVDRWDVRRDGTESLYEQRRIIDVNRGSTGILLPPLLH